MSKAFDECIQSVFSSKSNTIREEFAYKLLGC